MGDIRRLERVRTWAAGLFGTTRDQGQNDTAYGSGTDNAGSPFGPDFREIDSDTEGNDGEYEPEQTPAICSRP